MLALAGCRVIISSRSVSAGEAAIQAMNASTESSGYAPGTSIPAGRITVRSLDLESLPSIREFAEGLQVRRFLRGSGHNTVRKDHFRAQAEPAIDFLVLNAGIMAVPKLEYTSHGFERQVRSAGLSCDHVRNHVALFQIGTNHFGHFYLVALLRAKLVSQVGAWESEAVSPFSVYACVTEPFKGAPCRLVVVSSSAHRMGTVDVKDLHFRRGRAYTPWSSYGQSKAANILFAKVRIAQESCSRDKYAPSIDFAAVGAGSAAG